MLLIFSFVSGLLSGFTKLGFNFFFVPLLYYSINNNSLPTNYTFHFCILLGSILSIIHLFFFFFFKFSYKNILHNFCFRLLFVCVLGSFFGGYSLFYFYSNHIKLFFGLSFFLSFFFLQTNIFSVFLKKQKLFFFIFTFFFLLSGIFIFYLPIILSKQKLEKTKCLDNSIFITIISLLFFIGSLILKFLILNELNMFLPLFSFVNFIFIFLFSTLGFFIGNKLIKIKIFNLHNFFFILFLFFGFVSIL